MIWVEPVTVAEARRLVKLWHRHLPDIQGGLFAASVVADRVCVGVAIAGLPARVWQGTRRIAITRVATTAEPMACSMLYGALCAAAKAIGYREAWTYTLPDEPGISLRAAGFQDKGVGRGGELDRPGRPRRPVKDARPKRRWMRLLHGLRLDDWGAPL